MPLTLLSSLTSPYARKCRIAAREKGVALEEVAVSALEDPEALIRANPLCKVPALVLEGGETLFDSPLICAWLDAHGAQPPLQPTYASPAWFAMKRFEALADGIMDAAVSTALEWRRPASEQSPNWIARQRRAVERALDEAEAGPLPQGLDLGAIALAVACLYLDLRVVAGDWRADRPKLTAWAGAHAARESFVATAPPKAKA